MIFQITPYQSVGPLDWSMDQAAVERVLGAPDRLSRNRAGNTVEGRKELELTTIFDKDTRLLVEVGFSKLPQTFYFGDLDLIGSNPADVLRSLLAQDPTAVEGFGSQVFPALGISLTGFEPENEDVKAATAFARGRWDEMLPKMNRLMA